jgi:hypothetical protein
VDEERFEKTERYRISVFLENLIDKYKHAELTDDQDQRITEFFAREAFINKETSEEKDPLTYLSLGWYVYELLNKNKKT